MKFILTLALVSAVLVSVAQPPREADAAAGQTLSAPKTNAPPPADPNAFFKMHWDNRVRSFKEQNLPWRNVVLHQRRFAFNR